MIKPPISANDAMRSSIKIRYASISIAILIDRIHPTTHHHYRSKCVRRFLANVIALHVNSVYNTHSLDVLLCLDLHAHVDADTHDTQVVAIPSPADEFVFQGVRIHHHDRHIPQRKQSLQTIQFQQIAPLLRQSKHIS